jgi:hypothetical protein
VFSQRPLGAAVFLLCSSRKGKSRDVFSAWNAPIRHYKVFRMPPQQIAAAGRYVPWDVEIARYNFGANCGPIAFAVTARLEVCDVMQFFPHFADEQMRWTNSLQMRRALASAGIQAGATERSMPKSGVALIQWTGPWSDRSRFNRGSLRYTHWIAVDEDHVFDPNAGEWMSSAEWATNFAPSCVDEIPGANGWGVKYGFATTSSHTICPSTSAGTRVCFSPTLLAFIDRSRSRTF